MRRFAQGRRGRPGRAIEGRAVEGRAKIRRSRKIDVDDNMVAVVLGDSPIRLWGLTPAERIERQLRVEAHPRMARRPRRVAGRTRTLLLLRGDCLYDARVIRGLAKTRQALLEVDVDGRSMPVAAHVDVDQVAAAGECEAGRRVASRPARGIATVTPRRRRAGLRSGVEETRSSLRSPGHRRATAALEKLTFSGAYKGVTDLVTKWLWPVPAQCGHAMVRPHRHHAQPGDGREPRAGHRRRRAVRARRVRLGSRRGLDHDLSRHRRRQARARDDHLDQARQRVRPRHRPHSSSVLVPRVGDGTGALDPPAIAGIPLSWIYWGDPRAATSAAASAKARSSSSSRASRSSRGVRSTRGSG